MKVLVTGGTGTISSGLVKECVRNGYDTYSITRGENKNRNIDGSNNIYCNVWDTNTVRENIKSMYFDVVVECLVYNIEQLKISLNNFGDKCKQYIFISTSGIYCRDSEIISEDNEKKLNEWSYTKSKIECEEYLKQESEKYDFRYTIVRPVVTYGDYRVPFPISTRNPVWSFFQRIKDGKPIIACNNVKFSVIHIDDFSYATIGLFDNEKAYNEDFHIATKDSVIYWDDIVAIASKLLNVSCNIVHIPLERYKIMFPEIYDELKWNKSTSLIVSEDKIKKAVPKFKQTVSIEEGIRRLIEKAYLEFVDNNLEVDLFWNRCCDKTLFYSYSKKDICESEKMIVKKYKKRLSKKELIYIRKDIVKRIIKSRMKK